MSCLKATELLEKTTNDHKETKYEQKEEIKYQKTQRHKKEMHDEQ